VKMLKFAFINFSVLTIALAQIGSPLPAVDVYNSNLGYVREWRNFDLQKGINTLQIDRVSLQIDPASVHLAFGRSAKEIKILEQILLRPQVDYLSLWQANIGHALTCQLKNGSTISGVLLNYDGNNVILQLQDGNIISIAVDNLATTQFSQHPRTQILTPTLVWCVDSKIKATLPAEISYLITGINWRAEYVLNLNSDESNFNLASWVVLNNNSGLSFDSANLRLVAGKINRLSEAAPVPLRSEYAFAAKSAETPDFEEQSAADYHTYTLDRAVTIGGQEMKQIAFLEEVQSRGIKTYLFRNRAASEAEGNLQTTFRFANTKANNLGIPLPAGKVRLFLKSENSQLFLGEDQVGHVSVNDTVALRIGEAFDVKGRHMIKERTSPKPRSEMMTIEIEIINNKTTPIDVRVEELLDGDWFVKNASHRYWRLSNRLLLFPLHLDANQKSTITYTFQRNW